MRVVRLSDDAVIPDRRRPGDAGFDLYASEPAFMDPGERVLVPCGIQIELPMFMAGLVVPRSGMAIHSGVTVLNAPGLIDPNYRGEIGVILVNHGDDVYGVRPGDRIAQLLVIPCYRYDAVEVSSLSETVRGEAGFGSSGR